MEHSKKGRARRKNPLDPTVDGKRRPTIMKHVHMARKREDSVWTRPQKVIDNYPNIEEEDWVKFVQYRTSSQFQQLSNRGSEIRTNNEYSSRGGRDGYRKLDQEKYKNIGKWEKRDALWLDQQTGEDGELKDPACKKVSELIESQGTFESVGTSDVLSQALSRPNTKDISVGNQKLKALVRGLCAKKDVEPSFDPNNVPTIDQHNNFKASCSVQEKQHGVSDPPTMPVESQKCKLYIFDEVHGGKLLVAFGRTWLESLPNDIVHGIPLGEGNVRVSINVPKLKKATLPIPTYEATTVEDVVNGYLEELCRINWQAEKFVFVSPTLISTVRIDTDNAGMRERADILVSFLHDAPKGRLYLVPHNRGRHWVLGPMGGPRPLF
ncbi:hypothetical protein TIFTF001_032041 [Ficus carica]|uniref:Ubiquitin-like protease family profile domain-containing protein n=1 Tax=Ficus carica TaxID=3494 RepID=A0AA88DW75_FICCA|nr:hypothetical protein TIFTF001_032041 [Ficus carica]